MLVSRRVRQSFQPFLKCRGFAGRKDDVDDDDNDSDDDKEEAAPVKKMKPNKKNMNKTMDGMNPKQKTEVIQQFYDAAEKSLKYKPPFTDEEKAENYRIGRNYNIEAFKRHNRDGKDYATKIWLSSEAMKSLRPDLREAAMIIDEEGPPKDRPWPMFITPPIKGFRLRDYVQKSESNAPEFNL